MSISYDAVIVVGLPFNEVCEDSDEFYDKYEDKLDRISPYFDASNDDCLIGITYASSCDYQYKELASEFTMKANLALFKQITGKEGKVYLSVNGT